MAKIGEMKDLGEDHSSCAEDGKASQLVRSMRTGGLPPRIGNGTRRAPSFFSIMRRYYLGVRDIQTAFKAGGEI